MDLKDYNCSLPSAEYNTNYSVGITVRLMEPTRTEEMFFKYLKNLMQLYAVNWTLNLSHFALGLVPSHAVLTFHIFTVKTIRKYVLY